MCFLCREQVRIEKEQECIYLEGAGMNSTFLEWDGHAQIGPITSATLDTRADNVVAKGITFTVPIY